MSWQMLILQIALLGAGTTLILMGHKVEGMGILGMAGGQHLPQVVQRAKPPKP